MKKIHQSKTVWFNIALIIVESFLASMALIKGEISPMTFAAINAVLVSFQGVVNLYLRIYKTEVPIERKG